MLAGKRRFVGLVLFVCVVVALVGPGVVASVGTRDLLCAGLPSILFVSYVLLAVTSGSFAGTTAGVENLALSFGLAYAVALLPFTVLTSYILPAAAIAERATVSGGFILDGRSHQPLSEGRAPTVERSRPGRSDD